MFNLRRVYVYLDFDLEQVPSLSAMPAPEPICGETNGAHYNYFMVIVNTYELEHSFQPKTDQSFQNVYVENRPLIPVVVPVLLRSGAPAGLYPRSNDRQHIRQATMECMGPLLPDKSPSLRGQRPGTGFGTRGG